MLLASLSGCGGSGDGRASAPVIARVGDHDVTRDEFASYLAEALGEPSQTAVEPEVKSRLLDQFLDEELLLAEARRRKLNVSEQEALAKGPGEGADPARVRRVLLLKRFKEEVILRGVTVSEEEIRRQFETHVEEYHRPATAVLRKVLLDSAEEANDVRKQLEAAPTQFETIAETRSLSPDGGQPQAYDETVLPDSLRAAVASLHEGELSPVIEDPQGFFIVKLEGRQPERAPSLQEVSKEIELHLLQEKSQQRYREAVALLRQGTSVEIFPDKLDFTYRSRKQNS